MQNRWQLLESLRTGKITHQQARAAFEAGWQVAAAEHLKQYYACSTAAARQAYLDAMIDDMERAERMRSMMSLGIVAKPKPQLIDPGAIKDRLEQMPPGMRSQMAGLYADMRKRRVQRGLPAEPTRGR